MMNRQVVVIGGGISGLVACWKLAQAGIKDILLLEANEYIGGRMRTITVDGTPINMGCNWFHFIPDNNSLYQFARRNIPAMFEPPEKAHVCKPSALFHDSFKLVMEPGVGDTKSCSTSVNDLFHRCHSLYMSISSGNHDNQEPPNVHDNFHLKYFTGLSKMNLNEDEMKLATSMFHSFLLTESWNQGTDTLNNVSVSGSGASLEQLFLGSHVEVVKGYQEVVSYFVSQLEPRIICRNHEVVKIIYDPDSSNGSVKLLVNHKPPSGEEDVSMEIECQHVIVTCPLKYLQKHHSNMFTPKLSSFKIKALASEHMGLVEKVCLEFTEPVKFNDDGSAPGIWPLYNLKWDENRHEWWRKFTSWTVKGENKNIIMGTLIGEAAKAMNSETLEEVGKKCLTQLETMLGTKLQKPCSVTRSGWEHNPFVQGSYTSFLVDTVKEAANVLAEPISNVNGKPLVMFAGEHTSYTMYASVQGAFDSGLREADRLIEYLNKCN